MIDLTRVRPLIDCDICRAPTRPTDLTETTVAGAIIGAEFIGRTIAVQRLIWVCPNCPIIGGTMRVTTTYDVITERATRSGKCRCGKRVRRSQTFSQTQSPYNRNDEGRPRSQLEIRAALAKEADAWLPDFTCAGCLDES